MRKGIDYLIFANAALTVVMTLVVIYTIWSPYDMGHDMTWKIVGSYFVIVINLVVLFKIRDIYSTKEMEIADASAKDKK